MKGDNRSVGHNKKKLLKRAVILLAIIVLILTIWSLFFEYTDCTNWQCFNDHLKNCDKATFVGGTNMIFNYRILGASDAGCSVSVQLLQGDLNNADSIKLEKQKMTCILPRGIAMIPESNIGNCHGLLKENLQDLIIKKLHTYIVQNLGKINLEMLNSSGVN